MWLTILWELYSTALTLSCHETTASNNNLHNVGLSADSGCYSEFRPSGSLQSTDRTRILSGFTFFLVTSVLAQPTTGSETQGLKWQQQPGSQHFTGLNYRAANTQPGTSSSSVFLVLLLHSCNCWVPPHSLWRGVEGLFVSFMWKQSYIFLCGRMQHSSYKNQK